MTKAGKLLARFRGDATLSFSELQAILILHGFRLDRTSGSHHIYVHPGGSRPGSIQPDGKAAKRYLRQVRDTIEEFELRPAEE